MVYVEIFNCDTFKFEFRKTQTIKEVKRFFGKNESYGSSKGCNF